MNFKNIFLLFHIHSKKKTKLFSIICQIRLYYQNFYLIVPILLDKGVESSCDKVNSSWEMKAINSLYVKMLNYKVDTEIQTQSIFYHCLLVFLRRKCTVTFFQDDLPLERQLLLDNIDFPTRGRILCKLPNLP